MDPDTISGPAPLKPKGALPVGKEVDVAGIDATLISWSDMG